MNSMASQNDIAYLKGYEDYQPSTAKSQRN